MRAGTVEGYITGGHAIYLRDLMLEAGVDPQEQSSFTIENRYRYNPTFASIRSMGPSIPAMLLMLFPVILMAVSVAREKEIGTITNFYVTPTNRIEFLVGKQLPYVAIAMCNYLVLTLMVIFVLDVPLKGSLSAMTLGALCYGFAVTAYGLVVSSLVKTQVAAVFAAALLSLMPTMQYSGMIQPISTLSPEAQMIGSAWPASYFMHLSVGAYTKGLGWAALSHDIVKLSLFFPVFLTIAVLLLRKQEK
jgi:ribosome-dependent ATPase